MLDHEMAGPLDLVRDWRADLSTETYVSASRVQDRLLGLWGDVGERGTALVEPWLALTPHRNLFAAAELLGLLDEIEATLDVPGVDESPDLVVAG